MVAAHALLGRAYHNLNQTLLGIEQFKAALGDRSHASSGAFSFGLRRIVVGDRATAIAEFAAETRANPDFDDPYWIMGNIEF